MTRFSKNHKSSPPVAIDAKSWHDVLAVHPAAEFLPLMKDVDPEALRALAEDLKVNPLQNPIVIWQSYAEAEPFEQLLDGRNRLDALELAGLLIIDVDGMNIWLRGSDGKRHPIPTTYVEARTCKSNPYALVTSLNLHRRHQTAESKRDTIAKLLKATPENSDRQIAETARVSHHTVKDVRTGLESTGQIAQLKKTIGKDGKARKAPTKDPDAAIRRAVRKAVRKAMREEEAKAAATVGNAVNPETSADQPKAEAAAAEQAAVAPPRTTIAEAVQARGWPIPTGLGTLLTAVTIVQLPVEAPTDELAAAIRDANMTGTLSPARLRSVANLLLGIVTALERAAPKPFAEPKKAAVPPPVDPTDTSLPTKH